MTKKKTAVFELFGGPYDGFTYEPATQKISVIHGDDPQLGMYRASYDSDSDILEFSGPLGTAAYDWRIVYRKSRWAYRKDSLR